MKKTSPSLSAIFSKKFSILLLLAATPFAVSNGETLSHVKDVRFYAAVMGQKADRLIFTNVRATSATTDLNDYLIVSYPFDRTSLDLTEADVTVFPSVGTFNFEKSTFMRDVVAAPVLNYEGKGYNEGPTPTFNNVNGLTPFVFDLKVGTSFALQILSTTSPLQMLVSDVNSRTAPQMYGYPVEPIGGSYTSGNGLHRYSILKTGKYYVWLKPSTSTAKISFAFYNENPFKMNVSPLKEGPISVSSTLRGNTQDYAKWKLSLQKGQDIRIVQTGGANITWNLFSADGVFMNKSSLAPSTSGDIRLWKDLPSAGVYFVTAEKSAPDASNTTVNATIYIDP